MFIIQLVKLYQINLRLQNDGELCIKGPYVTKAYYKENNDKIFKMAGSILKIFLKKKMVIILLLIEKKDIYKNSRGQTIAPQKIENLFQDFDAIKSIFLVGDGKEFNSVLIYPDYANSPVDLKLESDKNIRDFLAL